MSADPLEALQEQLRRHPPERHPLQHATAQFHLGGLLLDRGALEEAEQSFTAAAALFRARGARAEHAKALNGLGAALRAAGRLELAAEALEHAAAGLAAAGLPLDEGAARFNLGLVLRESDRVNAAVAALARAAELLDPAVVPGQAAAAACELGVTHLQRGDLDDAEPALAAASALADRAGDPVLLAAAANALGLVRLAAGRAEEAAEAFSTAVAASPRALRPDAFAMAKANLALAYEGCGREAHARLAARQALGVPDAPEPVRAQAAALLARLRPGAADLQTVLAERPAAEQTLVAREELARSADAGPEERRSDMREWIEAHAASQTTAADVAEVWLGALLELPPEALERLVRSAFEAAGDVDPTARDTFREAVTRAMARFGVPQWMRLQEVFSHAAAEAGDPAAWR